ncbi:hypothetical protein VK792_14985, partial [Mesobacterium sp. TK19101]
ISMTRTASTKWESQFGLVCRDQSTSGCAAVPEQCAPWRAARLAMMEGTAEKWTSSPVRNITKT